jgi:hypothetical protein
MPILRTKISRLAEVPFYAQVYYRVPENERKKITGKWVEKARVGRFMGYAQGGKGTFVIKTNTGQIIERKNIIVDKDYLLMREIAVEDEILEPVENQELNFEDSNDDIELVAMVRLAYDEVQYHYCNEVKSSVLHSPKDFEEILTRDDIEKWFEAIRNEEKNLLDSGVFEVVESVPKNAKILRSRMVYQLSEKNDGNHD